MSPNSRRTLPRRAALPTAVVAAVASFLVWGVAGASAHGLTTGFADYTYTSGSPQTRAFWLNRAHEARAGILRVNVVWRAIEPTQPASPTDPNDRAYHFHHLDDVVSDIRARGMKVLFTVYDAPAWAEGANPAASAGEGAWRPSPAAYGAFAQALAKRYSGNFHDRTGALVPPVHAFEAWNEPNLAAYLAPQWNGHKPASPSIYRNLLNAFYAGIHKGQKKATVVGGATAPYGDPPGGSRMRPFTFLRTMFCLNGKLKATKCDSKVHLNVLSHHPITAPGVGPPTHTALNPGDLDVADFHKVRKILHKAERAKHVSKPHSHHPLWATEFWWYSNPPNNQFGLPLSKQARYIEQTFYMLWKQGASVALNYAIGDGPYDPNNALGTLQTGVFFNNGRKKPSFKAFRFPFVAHRASHKKTLAWGKAPRAGKLKIQKAHGKGWRTVKKFHVHGGEVFTTHLGRHARGKLRAVVGGDTSLVWH
jgi:hypothetical protein